MNRELLEKRLVELVEQRDQMIANINLVLGAIQDCEYWLSQIDEPQQPEE